MKTTTSISESKLKESSRHSDRIYPLFEERQEVRRMADEMNLGESSLKAYSTKPAYISKRK